MFLVLYFYLFQANLRMDEPPKRQSTRVKKPSKYMQMMENDFNAFNEPKICENKDPISNPQENNQLAKLLVKFLNSANNKLKCHLQNPLPLPHSQLPTENSQHPRQEDLFSTLPAPEGISSAKVKSLSAAESSKVSSRVQGKRGESGKKGFPTPIQNGLSYQAMIGKHLKSTIQDSKNASPDLLMKLDLPTTEGLNAGREKEKKRKKRGEVNFEQGGYESKPFRRQSYHIAIAYHIYLKSIKESENPSLKDIDPTFKARKLRQQQLQKQV